MAITCYCNKCGKKIDNYHVFIGLTATNSLGYGSKYDGDLLQLDLCTDCMDELIDACAITPVEEKI